MDVRSSNLLDEALGISGNNDHVISKSSWPLSGQVILIEDCVETSGSFILHHLIKRLLSSQSSSSVVVFIAFAQPFSHYDRILRKLGCNLAAQRDNKRFVFVDMLKLECSGEDGEGNGEDRLVGLFRNLFKAISDLSRDGEKSVTIMVDDVSLMEVATRGSTNQVLDFLHYCRTLTSEYGCSLVTLSHEDIYWSTDRPTFVLQLEYLADVIIKTEPLATGLATYVHGQLTVQNKESVDKPGNSRKNVCNFHFRVKENSVEYFYPGSRT